MGAEGDQLTPRWAACLIDRAVANGIEDFCIAPGSRSAPLALAASHRARTSGDCRLHTHFDERGLGFLGLGLARGRPGPVALITTSGTAVSNLHPALTEARQSGVPLLALTADRPVELHDCAANQAIDQNGIFAQQVAWQLNLPEPDERLLGGWLPQRLDQALEHLAGPAQINVPLREPLYEAPAPTTKLAGHPARQPNPQCTCTGPRLPLEPPVLFVAGQLSVTESQALLAAAESRNIPLLADYGSQLRLLDHPCVYPAPDALVATPEGRDALTRVGTVVQFGGRLTGRRLTAWLDTEAPRRWIVSPTGENLDPCWQARTVIGSVASICAALPPLSQASLQGLSAARQRFHSARQAILDADDFAEPQAAALISESLPAGMTLFAGNSLPIRALDLFASQGSGNPVLTQRGASGIDGLIATAAGYTRTQTAGTTLLIGDLSALHDLNSLPLLMHSPHPCVVVALNNDGGGIFGLLPAAEHGPVHDTLFRMPHGFKLEAAAQGFGVPYRPCATPDELKIAYTQACQRSGGSVLEVFCAPHGCRSQMRHLFETLEAD